jgi:hypothetical protein
VESAFVAAGLALADPATAGPWKTTGSAKIGLAKTDLEKLGSAKIGPAAAGLA